MASSPDLPNDDVDSYKSRILDSILAAGISRKNGSAVVSAEPSRLQSAIYLFLVEIYCVITTALWSRDGSAVVSLHPPAASMESSVRFL